MSELYLYDVLMQNSICVQQVLGSFPGKEELESSLKKLEKNLKETSREKDKALQQLNRLKQHLLEKVLYPEFLSYFLPPILLFKMSWYSSFVAVLDV